MSNRTSAIQHPANSPFVMLRSEYLSICDNDHCAAILLGVMESWHNTKIRNQPQAALENKMAEYEGLPAGNTTDLWVYMSYDQFAESIMGLFGETKIAAGVKLLLEKGFLQSRTNPKHRYDRIPQYLFIVDAVQSALGVKIVDPVRETTGSTTQKDAVTKRKNTSAIPKNHSDSQKPLASADATTQKRAKAPAEPTVPVSAMTPMKDALAAAFGYDWNTMTGTEKGMVQKAAKELCQANRQPEDVQKIYDWCIAQGWDRRGGGKFTPIALLKHTSDALSTQSQELRGGDIKTMIYRN